MHQVILCTCPNEASATQIATTLVEEQLAACANILPKIKSVYRWQGKVEQDNEYLLLIKTLETQFQPVKERIQELHSYDVPEVIALNIQQGNKEYLDWISNSILL